MEKLRFGTDGWRAIIADGFTFQNVRLIVQALADYVRSTDVHQQGLLLSYDTRFMGEKFALAAAEVLAGNEIPTYMTSGPLPTPVVAWGIKDMETAGAVVITASHNPPEYSGLKFIPDYAGPATTEITSVIEKNIEMVSEEHIKVSGLPSTYIEEADPVPSYLEHLRKMLDFSSLRKAKLKVAVDPMYGASQGLMEQILEEAGCDVIAIHSSRDPLFGGSLPDPTEANLTELIAEVERNGADIGLALDGDGDRFSAVDPQEGYLNPNRVLSIIADYLLEERKMSGDLVRSVATTHLLDALASRYGRSIYETPVGFKHIGQKMRESSVLMGAEESGGFSMRGHIPEKDGILATMMLAQIRAGGKPLSEILGRIHDDFGFFISRRVDISYHPANASEVQKKVESPPRLPAKYEIKSLVEVDGRKYLLADGSWILVRSSGTEPVVRIYLESHSSAEVDELEQCMRTMWKDEVTTLA